MNWWLHLIWLALFEIHPSRRVSLDKCSHQGVAHWHQYALHGAPSHSRTGGTTFVLRGGVPCAVMGCLSPTGWYTMDVPCWWRMAKKMPHHGPAVLTHMTLSSSRWKSFLQLYERGTPCGRAHCARHTDANMHFLDGYTCQGTPSKVDKPQIKSSHQVEPL